MTTSSAQAEWWGPPLDGDQRELRTMLDGFIASRGEVLDDGADVQAVITELAGLGVWTLGTAEALGGGGADNTTTLIALERVARAWPALAWASVQAHAAVAALGAVDEFTELVAQIHDGAAAVAVVDADATHVRLNYDGRWSGSVARVDVAASDPHLLVLNGPDRAHFFPSSVMTSKSLRRTGFGGAMTRSLQIDATDDDVAEISEMDGSASRVTLRQGAAAVAAGIAGAAATAAHSYAADRRQFGAALRAIPTVRQSLLNQRATAGTILSAALAASADTVTAFSAMRTACDMAIDVAASALQSHGGYGYLTEYPVERHLRDAVSLRAAVDAWGAAVVTAAQICGQPGGEAIFGREAC
ncbi:hypothetical protein FHT40_006770 [Mycolicibacterium sp. BK556]|uniref:acyl-CoA dehydrogenase family protein n=1 Tax=unclassified Mycolicibacterium TaxID=2636767 RepID=UPI00161AF0D7|nr:MULTISPECIES: acyl-CoA dehydrogenase family protein [unclassified Mycolicibacterium]MBB3607070.1 hypothetical protein [Mycolicibacterium sp. BK556]MBB3636820.1 hypothetical protein [Mycolicibacterium sp. BK607]